MYAAAVRPLLVGELHDVIAGVNGDLTEDPFARANETVYRPGRNDDDLSRARLDRLVVNRERSLPFLDDEGLLTGVVVKAGAGAGGW
jgi:hypothetical protein